MVENQKYYDSDDESSNVTADEEEASLENSQSVNTSELSGDLDDLLDEIDQGLVDEIQHYPSVWIEDWGLLAWGGKSIGRACTLFLGISAVHTLQALRQLLD